MTVMSSIEKIKGDSETPSHHVASEARKKWAMRSCMEKGDRAQKETVRGKDGLGRDGGVV